MAYDSRSSHMRNHGNRYYRNPWTQPRHGNHALALMPDHEAVKASIAAEIDLDEPAYLGLKRLGGLATWEVMLLQWAAESGTDPQTLLESGMSDEEFALADVRYLRDTWRPEELAAEGLPENVAWSSVLVDETLAEYLTRTEYESEAEDEPTDWTPWMPYMPLAEFREHMEHYDGWHVIHVGA